MNWLIHLDRKDPFDQRAPRAYLTAFGWCIGGPSGRPDNGANNCYHFSTVERDCDVMLQQFIEANTFGTKLTAQNLLARKRNERGRSWTAPLDALAKGTRWVCSRKRMIPLSQTTSSLPNNDDFLTSKENSPKTRNFLSLTGQSSTPTSTWSTLENYQRKKLTPIRMGEPGIARIIPSSIRTSREIAKSFSTCPPSIKECASMTFF